MKKNQSWRLTLRLEGVMNSGDLDEDRSRVAGPGSIRKGREHNQILGLYIGKGGVPRDDPFRIQD